MDTVVLNVFIDYLKAQILYGSGSSKKYIYKPNKLNYNISLDIIA